MKDHVITARIGPNRVPDAVPATNDLPGGTAHDKSQVPPPKHVVLDAGENGRIDVGMRSWADSIRDKLNSSPSGVGGRKALAVASAEAWVPPR